MVIIKVGVTKVVMVMVKEAMDMDQDMMATVEQVVMTTMVDMVVTVAIQTILVTEIMVNTLLTIRTTNRIRVIITIKTNIK